MLSEIPYPIIFAHRGSSLHAPENTLAAFDLALQHGADAIELDAKLTRDEQVIVIHDQSLDRTTDGSGQINSFSLAELKDLDAGSHFDSAFKGEKIPTLEEVFERFGNYTHINVELTNYATSSDQLPEKVAELVSRYHLERRVLFSSFNPRSLSRIHKILPQVPIGLLALPGWKGALARSWMNRWIPHQALHPEVHDVTPSLVRKIQRRQKRIFVYTVNTLDEIQTMAEMGVDGIFTDDPPLARKVFQENAERESRHKGRT